MRGLPSGEVVISGLSDWRKEMPLKQFDRILLTLEAILIIISLAGYGQAVVGMICYWSAVVIYHLTDIILERKNNGNK